MSPWSVDLRPGNQMSGLGFLGTSATPLPSAFSYMPHSIAHIGHVPYQPLRTPRIDGTRPFLSTAGGDVSTMNSVLPLRINEVVSSNTPTLAQLIEVK